MTSLKKYIFCLMLIAGMTACREQQSENHHQHQTSVTSKKNHALMLSENQLKLANIKTQSVSPQDIGEAIVLTGRVVANQDRSSVITSRASGRIESLPFKQTGMPVKKGDVLYAIYSEGLQTLQQEFLLAKDQYETMGKTNRYESFYKAAAQKLRLYGLTQTQIDELGNSKKSRPTLKFISPVSGVIQEINVTEGGYVNEGARMFNIEDTGSLWVEAELYANEATFAKVGDRVTVIVNGFETTPIDATITFLNPEYNSSSQVLVLRAAIENSSNMLISGMPAQIRLKHSSTRSLAVPTNAVIRDGRGARVYIQTGRNTFEPRVVRTGLEDFDHIEIKEGLLEKDTIAVSGVYLLHSAMLNAQ